MDPAQSGGDWTHALFVREFEKRERQGAIESSRADYSAAAVQRKGQLANFVRAHTKKKNTKLVSLYVTCSCINRCIFFKKRPTNALPCMNVILLYSNHRHVSATHMDETFIHCSAFVGPFEKFRSVDYSNDKIHGVRKRLNPFFYFSRCPVCGEWCKLH